MMYSRRPACLADRRSRSPGSRSATPRRWSPNPRSEHDREASSRPSRVHVCGRVGSDRPARAGYRLHPGGGGMWAQGEQQGDQWHGIAQDRDEHGKSSGAWYYLARYYMAVNDLAGADSAFTKALALAPGCKDDIAFHRREAWVPVFNAATAAWQAGNSDSAIASFRRANQIYQAEPLGFIYLANLFIAREEPDSARKQANAAKYHMDSLVYATRMDSAAKYFRLAVPAASDPKYANDRREAWLNVARVYHTAKRYDEAAAAYREFLGAYPNDVQARANLAELYLRGNQRDSAMALYEAITAHADSASADDLFGAAGAVLSAIPQTPDTIELDAACGKALKKKTPTVTARQISTRCQPAAADTMQKFHALADPLYRLGVQTYQAGLVKNPYHRDALYNLTGISFVLNDTAKVLLLAQRLYAVDA